MQGACQRQISAVPGSRLARAPHLPALASVTARRHGSVAPDPNTPDRRRLTRMSPEKPPHQEPPDDEELDRFILARLRLAGVDLSVLPEDDPEAPADRKRVLAAARTFLRSTPPRIAELELDPLGAPPAMYPAELGVWTDERS